MKIRAIANDARGDPATRATAAAILKRYEKEQPEKRFRGDPRNADPRVYGLRRRDPLYEHYVYTDLSQWGKTKAGNPTYTLFYNGASYQIVLFKHKKTDTYGWMVIEGGSQKTEYSGKFDTMAEAQQDAWVSLMMS